MDPALWELSEGDADEEIAVIIRLYQPHVVPAGVRVIAQFGNIVTCRLKRSAIIGVRADEPVASMKAPTLLVPDFDVDPLQEFEEVYEPSPEGDDRRPRLESATGKGVVLGVIDWGCDFTHPDFRHPDGSTRLLALWDQTASVSDADNRYGYGRIHSAEAINRALTSEDPYAALQYYPSRSDVGGKGTHGTHVLSIAAGNGRGGGPSGVAPEADLVFVHLANAKGVQAQSNMGNSFTILEGVDFILRMAENRGKDKVVSSLSMGRHGGPHDGSTLVEQAFDAFVAAAPGRAIVQSTGNYYDRSVHASGQIHPGQTTTIPFTVGEADITPNELEVWYPGRDVLTVQVRSPGGEVSKKTPLDDQASIRIDGRAVCRVYHRARDPNNLDNHIHLFMYPRSPSGTWEVILKGEDVVDGRFHVWIERDAACPGCQSRFPFDFAEPRMTTGTICNGLRTIAVGAYNAHDPERKLGSFSSSGPTRDGRGKPDLVAPGVGILAARSAPGASDGESPPLYTRKSGTSMAAPHVAGTVALMFEVAGRPLHIQETRNLLMSSAQPADVAGADPYRVGSGYLDIDAAIASTRRHVGGQQPVESESDLEASMADYPHEVLHDAEGSAENLEGTNMGETDWDEGEADWGEGIAEWVESADSELEGETPLPVQTHLQRVMARSELPAVHSPRDLYHAFVSGVPQGLARVFDVVAMPGSVLGDRLRPGDLLLRRIPEDGYIHLAFLASDDLLPPQQALGRGWTLETLRPGYYTLVVEAGPRPHRATHHYARRVLDGRGLLPPNHLVLRLRMRSTAQIEPADVEADDFLRPCLDCPDAAEDLPALAHTCQPGEGPPAPEPDPTGRGLHPLLMRGVSTSRSRRPSVGYAQQCLNNFLAQLTAGAACSPEAEPQQFIAANLATLRRANALPLAVDCRFGEHTQRATRIFQACMGIARDGKIGPITWPLLETFASSVVPPIVPPAIPPVEPVSNFEELKRRYMLDSLEGSAGSIPSGLPRISVPIYTECEITPLINGPDFYRVVRDAINTLSGENQIIYIAGWWMESSFSLDGPTASTHIVDLLKTKSRSGVDVRVLGWVVAPEVASSRLLRSGLSIGGASFDPVRGLLGLNDDTIRFINDLRVEPSLADKAALNILAHPAGAVHLKFVLVGSDSQARGFTGGLDFQRGRWGSDWHDVQVGVRGPIVQGFYNIYRDMWNEIRGRSPVRVTALSNTADSHTSSMPALPPRSLRSPVAARVHAQSLRTLPQFNFSTLGSTVLPTNDSLSYAPRGLFEIKEAWKKALLAADTYIYIEDQGFWSVEVFDWLKSAIRSQSNLRIVLLTGRGDPNDPEAVRDRSVKFFARALRHLTDGLSAAQIARIAVFTHLTKTIHSKTTIIDDHWALIGSANAMRRSLYTDLEHSVPFMDENGRVVLAYRADLWGIHLGSIPADRSRAVDQWFAIPAGSTAHNMQRLNLPVPAVTLSSVDQLMYDEFLDADSRQTWGMGILRHLPTPLPVP